MYVKFTKNVFLADSSELMGVGIISASRALKRFIATYQTWCTSRLRKIFFSPIRVNWWVLESFRPPEPKNVWLLHSRHDVRRVHEKFFLADSSELMGVRVISASWAQKRLIPTFYTWCRSSSWKIFSLRFERTHFGLLSPKTFDSHFLDMMYVAFMKNFFSPIRANWWALGLFRAL